MAFVARCREDISGLIDCLVDTLPVIYRLQKAVVLEQDFGSMADDSSASSPDLPAPRDGSGTRDNDGDRRDGSGNGGLSQFPSTNIHDGGSGQPPGAGSSSRSSQRRMSQHDQHVI